MIRLYAYMNKDEPSASTELNDVAEAATKAKEENDRQTRRSSRAARLRIRADLQELELVETCRLFLPDRANLFHFIFIVRPDEGLYKGATFLLHCNFTPFYPFDPPKIKSETRMYHPHFDKEGNMYLNILREDWSPILNINSIIFGIVDLFTNPSSFAAYDKEAANLLENHLSQFKYHVRNMINETKDHVRTYLTSLNNH